MKNIKDTKIKERKKAQKTNRFIEIIKKRWIANTTRTVALVIIIVTFFIGISIFMKRLELTPIDLTEDKLFTLTEESKEQIKNINKDINIYFVGYEENSPTLDLAKQYKKENEKINIEAVTAVDRPDLVQKYGIDETSEGIIVETEKNYKVLTSNDLYTFNYETYETIDVTEEKLTAAIKTVSVEQLPKVYFLEGYSSFSLMNGMQYLNMYLENEINEIDTLDILVTGNVPEDCDTLVILTPQKDFDEIATNAILDYINRGGNILWLNAAVVNETNFENVNKILATYGINPFEVGIIRETDNNKMISGSPDLILPDIQYSDVTNKLINSQGVIFINATKINVVDDDTLDALDVEKIDLIKTSENAYFRTNFEITLDDAQSGEEKTSLLVGAQFNKTISNEDENEIKSTLIIYGENYFASDNQLMKTSSTPILVYGDNKDLVLNSIAYLTNREEDITVRKNTGAITYTATQKENNIILAIIIVVPVLIIIAGIVVWIIRKRKK